MRMLSHAPLGPVGTVRSPVYCSSPPGSKPVQIVSPLLVLMSAYSILTVSTCAEVRQVSASPALHKSDSGLKWHFFGSPIKPSFTPSSESQAASTALCSVSTLACDSTPWGLCINSTERSTLAACRWMCGFAGAPAITPSKSSGNLVTSTSACRPPVEQPFQYEYLAPDP